MLYLTINAAGALCLEGAQMRGFIPLCGLHGSVWCPGWLEDTDYPEPPF